MSETPPPEGEESSGGRARAALARLKSWPRTSQVLAAIAIILVIALVSLLAVLSAWRGSAQKWKDYAHAVEEERDSLQSEIEDLRGGLSDAEAEVAALKDLEAELAEREEALDVRAEELDAVEAAEDQREEAQDRGLTVGSTTTFDDWEITLADVETHGPINSSSPRGKYVVLLLDVTNNASHERQFLGIGRGFNLLDVENDREYTFDSSASLDYHQTFDTDAWHLEDLGPGLSGRIPVAIDVSEDTSWGMAAMVSSSGVSDPWLIENL